MRPLPRHLFSVVAAVAALSFCAHAAQPAQTNAAQAQPAPKVDVYHVAAAASVPIRFDYPARLTAYRFTTVTSRVSGVLQEKYYKEGEFVKKGAPLYRIEPDTYAAKVDETAADVELKNAALSNAQREWERVEHLYQNTAVSKKEYDAALSAYEVAKADLSSAKARLKAAKIDLGYTRVVAPISGIAGMKQIDIGNVVASGTPLVSLTQVDPIYAEFSIPDADLGKAGATLRTLAKSRKLPVSFTYEGQSVSGSVDYIAPQISSGNGSVKVRAQLKNPSNTLMPGAFGRIKIQDITTAPVLKVPQKAVLQNKMGTIVMVLEKGVVGVRPIRLGKKSGDYFIVNDGLKGGETVIVNNFFRIRPGAPATADKTVN